MPEHFYALTNMMFQALNNLGLLEWIIFGLVITWATSVLWDFLP